MTAGVATERVIIVGAGLAALYAALELAPRPVLVISPETLGEGASSAWAQGGVAAAMAPDDSPAAHAEDTVRAGAGMVDAAVAGHVTDEARAHIMALAALGTPFDRDGAGQFLLNREAAHRTARVVRVQGDQAGRRIMQTLIASVRAAPSVQVLEGVQAVALELTDGAVTGVQVEAAAGPPTRAVTLRGAATVLAGGGSCGLYALTTNPPRIRGQIVGMAARAGALIADAEFVQFHPTALDTGEDPAPLATEALRGEGAWLIDRQGKRFMAGLHPDMELAPRDVVARAIFAQTQAGNRPMLDLRRAPGAALRTQFPAVTEACARAGIDPTVQPVPVAAAAHYHMGGIATLEDGRASLGRLWVCGEVGSTGLHGANRLASNGLLEALVYARRCAESIAAVLGPPPAGACPPVSVAFTPGGQRPDPQAVAVLRRTMTERVGVVRNAEGLRAALRVIAGLEAAHPPCAAFANMTATATLIAAAAFARRESRGAHYRDDCPQSLPGPGQRSRMTLPEALALRDAALKEPA